MPLFADDQDVIRGVTTGLNTLISLVGGHTEVLPPAANGISVSALSLISLKKGMDIQHKSGFFMLFSTPVHQDCLLICYFGLETLKYLFPGFTCLQVNSTHVTVRGRVVIRGLPSIPDNIATFITNTVDGFLTTKLNAAREQMPAALSQANISEFRLGFGNEPEVDLPESRTSQNLVVSLDMADVAAARALEDNLVLINMMMSLFQTAVVPPGANIRLADDPLSIDGTKGWCQSGSSPRIFGSGLVFLVHNGTVCLLSSSKVEKVIFIITCVSRKLHPSDESILNIHAGIADELIASDH